MYLAMHDFGTDNVLEISKYNKSSDKWKKLDEIAQSFSIRGIQFSPDKYKRVGLSLRDIPESLNKYRLTYHLGGLYKLISDEEYIKLDEMLKESYEIAYMFGMEDLSFHPPYLPEDLHDMRKLSRNLLKKAIEKWLYKFTNKGIKLSIETHINSKYFVFLGLDDYVDFISGFENLGILIDISHNFNEGFEPENLITRLMHLNITGFHLSDAIANEELEKGTHLVIGKGNIDFKKVLSPFKNNESVYGALEVRCPSSDIFKSIAVLQGINK